MAKRVTVPLGVGGKFSGGDAAKIPPGQTLDMLNLVPRAAGAWVKRDPWLYDSKVSSVGRLLSPFALWDDLATASKRLMTLQGDSGALTETISLKAASGEAWTALSAAAVTLQQYLGTIGDYANLHGNLYANGSAGPSTSQGTTTHFNFNGTSRAPTGAALYGSNVIPTAFQSFSLCSFIDRLFFGWIQASVQNLLTLVRWQSAYSPADAAWTLTNLSSSSQTTGGATTYRILPTSTTSANATILATNNSIPANSAPLGAIYRSDLCNEDPAYSAPLTLDVLLATTWGTGLAYSVGDIIIPLAARNGFYYRCSTAGTSGGGEPAWGTTRGGTTADGGTLVWTNMGSESFGTLDVTLPTASTDFDFQPYWCSATIPPHTNNIGLAVRLKWGNIATPTGWTPTSVKVGYTDGLGATDPRKANRGQQLTLDTIKYPFFNREATGAVIMDIADIGWSETSQPGVIRASNTFQLVEAPGHVTCVRVCRERFFAMKRNAFGMFQGTDDPDNPLAIEDTFVGVGCLHHRAFDSLDGMAYWIGENEVYSYMPGKWTGGGAQAPQPLCGPAMREEVMNKATSSWVENQAANYNTPILAIDRRRRILYVYTQKAKIHGMYLDSGEWFRLDIATGSGTTAEVSSLIYDPQTLNMYALIAYPGASQQEVRRLDPSSSNDIDSAGGSWPVTAQVTFAPIEASAPRFEAVLDSARMFHQATASQSGQTVTAKVSFDQGQTFPKTATLTMSPLSTGGESVPLFLPVGPQLGESLTIAVAHAGKAGAANFSITRAEAAMRVMRGEWPKQLPTVQGASL